MRILLLEDLDTFAEALKQSIESKRFIDKSVSIKRVATELEFRRRLPELVKEPFQVAIFDVMVSWCAIEELETPEGQNTPPEVIAERDGLEKWRSGVRCQRMFDEAIAASGRPAIPCIFYSVLEKSDLAWETDADIPFVTKSGTLDPLVETIIQVTRRR